MAPALGASLLDFVVPGGDGSPDERATRPRPQRWTGRATRSSRTTARSKGRETMRVATWLIATAAGFTVALAAPAAANTDLKFMTGPQGGFWVPLGGALKDMWEKNVKGIAVQALPGAGVANVRGIEEGKADIGLGNVISTVDALAGAEPFKTQHKNVCNLAWLYPQYFQVVVRADSGINSVKDFKGKTLTTLPRGNTTEVAAQHLLKVNGVSYSDMKVNFVSASDSVSQMQDGHANVWAIATGIPAGGIMDLSSGREVKVLDLADSFDAMKKLNPGYELYTIPAGTYPKQAKDIKVAGFGAHIAVSCKLPEDVAYGMVKTMADNVPAMAAVGKMMTGLTPKMMAADVGVPMHPGARRFYKEKGIDVK
jgi:hypothetical protein